MMAVQTSEAAFAQNAGAFIHSGMAEKGIPRTGWQGAERRREVRYATCDPVQVSLLDLGGLEIAGVVRDVSKSGLRLEIGLPVIPGSRLKIRLRSHVIFGEVRYCFPARGTWQAGVAISEAYFQPCAASGTGGELGASRHDGHELARFIVDDHLCFSVADLVRSERRRIPPLSSDGVQ
jgi:hypothetical protein